MKQVAKHFALIFSFKAYYRDNLHRIAWAFRLALLPYYVRFVLALHVACALARVDTRNLPCATYIRQYEH